MPEDIPRSCANAMPFYVRDLASPRSDALVKEVLDHAPQTETTTFASKKRRVRKKFCQTWCWFRCHKKEWSVLKLITSF